ncbi:hypothetical protein ACJIZ3_024093 [Penstemon smallii]|uniref:Uncharacterized protein n=1 Tax=Penstemon smallii TaxID=265156 RepID=A0ABD3TRU1_9LAMI
MITFISDLNTKNMNCYYSSHKLGVINIFKLIIFFGFNPFRGGSGTLSGYLSQQGFEPESATL